MAVNKIHFISGLPRSGSTLLAALLRQNPAITAGITSPVLRIVQALEVMSARDKEVAGSLNDATKLALRRIVFDVIYKDCDIAIDTNKFWTAKMPLLAMMFPSAKVICCVRELSWIMDSWERLYAKNPLELSAMFGFKADTTVYSRVSRLASSEGLVGSSLDALREAFYGPFRDRLLLIEYRDLAMRPHYELGRVYEFIGENPFVHDYKNVKFSADSYDASLGMPGLHTVRGPVAYRPRETILPPDLFARFAGDNFWQRRVDSVKEIN